MGSRVTLASAFVVVGGLAMGVACGIDESGLAGDDASTFADGPMSDTAPPPDASTLDVPLPPSCATTDVSCFGFDGGLPDGWSAYVVEPDGGACPTGDYTGSTWQARARLAPQACSCECNSSGAWSCPSTIDLANGGICTTTFTVDAGACNAQNPVSQHLKLPNAPLALGSVTCTPDASAPTAITDPVMLCAAGCDAGTAAICTQPAGQRCIAADGIQACPASGLTQHVVGAGATAVCTGCSCNPPTRPTCSATAHVYNGYFNAGYHTDDTCMSGGSWNSQTLTLDNTCQLATNNYESFDVEWNAFPDPICAPVGGGGDAGLASPKTLCCN